MRKKNHCLSKLQGCRIRNVDGSRTERRDVPKGGRHVTRLTGISGAQRRVVHQRSHTEERYRVRGVPAGGVCPEVKECGEKLKQPPGGVDSLKRETKAFRQSAPTCGCKDNPQLRYGQVSETCLMDLTLNCDMRAASLAADLSCVWPVMMPLTSTLCPT